MAVVYTELGSAMQPEIQPVPPFSLQPRFQPRIWGAQDLGQFYPGRGREAEPVGETWLTGNDSLLQSTGQPLRQMVALLGARLLGGIRRQDDDFPLLVKFLFPRERLSVQVQPGDAYAARHGLGRGKTEMWHVVEAEPDARLGVNLLPKISIQEFIAACRQGRGADCLDWQVAAAGDTFYIPAGTIHAIGPGLVLCEVQQQSDNTFRLDDYGRIGA